MITKAQGYIDAGDLRFAAELLNHVVFADESNTVARELLARVYETLGFGAENGTWRNFYLQGAEELRHGVAAARADLAGASDMVRALTVDQLFDSLAIRVNGPKAWAEHLAIDWIFTDLGHSYRTELTNGVLIQRVDPDGGTADLTLTLTKPQLLALLGGAGFDGIDTQGDLGTVPRLLAVLYLPDRRSRIVTP